MPSTGLKRSAILERIIALLELLPGFTDVSVEIGAPRTEWAESSRYVLLSRVTGNIENPRLGAPNPQFEDHANVEIWCQGFGSTSEEAAAVAERTVDQVLLAIGPNRLLALNDGRLEGVQSSDFTEMDGPMFLGTDGGVIVSYRMILFVKTLVRPT